LYWELDTPPPSWLIFCCTEESFHLAWFLKNFLGIHFPQLHSTNMYRRVVSLGLENLTNFVPRFPRPSGPKQFCTWVYFPSAWFLKNLLGICFPQLHGTNTYIRVVSLGLASLRLLDPNIFFHGFTFPQPDFSKICSVTFPSASWHQHVEKSRFTRPGEPNEVCASLPSAFWTQTIFYMCLLSLSLISPILVRLRYPQLHGTNM